MPRTFILIPGRSARQGVALNEGKYTDGYLDETSTLRMHPDDMADVGIEAGDEVRMWNDVGSVTVPVISAVDECPPGLVFICYGDKSSRLMGGETHGSGMPDSKGLDVHIESAVAPVHNESALATSAAGSETVADDRPASAAPTEPDSDPVATRGLPPLDETNASGVAASSLPQSASEISTPASSSSSVSSTPPKLPAAGRQSTRPKTGASDREQDPVSTGQIVIVVLSLIAVLILLLTSGQ